MADSPSLHFDLEMRRREPHLRDPRFQAGASERRETIMGPGRTDGLGPSAAAVFATLMVALTVLAIVVVGGGMQHPLLAPAHVALAHSAPPHQG